MNDTIRIGSLGTFEWSNNKAMHAREALELTTWFGIGVQCMTVDPREMERVATYIITELCLTSIKIIAVQQATARSITEHSKDTASQHHAEFFLSDCRFSCAQAAGHIIPR